MTAQSDAWLLWTPRLLGILVCAFLSLFALDAFDHGKSFVSALPDFLIHLAPTAALLGVVVLSWRREWVGGVVFTGFAAGFAYLARRTAWIPIVSGPFLIVGVLFLWSWIRHRQARLAA